MAIPMDSLPSLADDRAVRSGVGWIDRSERVRLEITGPDRVRFLHNLTTNEVKRLPAGRGCEAFVTSLQGKTLGFVTLLAEPDRILLRSDPGALDSLLPHFQKYGALDDVAWTQAASAETFEWHLAGPNAEPLVHELSAGAVPQADLAHIRVDVDGRSLLVVREAPAGLPGLTLIGERDNAGVVNERLRSLGTRFGLVPLHPLLFDALRIEAGTPIFGRDINPANLPQEVGRDARAINFVKGCYLGQETVARIDALGHVNQLLKGLVFEEPQGPPPEPGARLEADGKPAGLLTSVAFSPAWGRFIGLGYVRGAHGQPGAEVKALREGTRHNAAVADLPLTPPAASDRSRGDR